MEKYLYLILTLGSLSVPLLYSVLEKKLHFIQFFKIAFLSILLVAIPFLIWDGFFTYYGVWGFNETYHLPFTLFGMPLGEWLFFFCIPYACLFTNEVLKHLFPKFKISKGAAIIISVILIIFIGILLIFNFGKLYTTVNFISFLFVLMYGLKKSPEVLETFYPNFIIVLIPFFVVNGILTGSFIESPMVWYNNDENLAFRLFTIPLEDVFYAFTMLFSSQLNFNFLKKRNYEKQ